MRRYIVVLLLVFLSFNSQAVERNCVADSLPRQGFFCHARYGQSLLADMHPYFFRLDFAGSTNHPAYDWALTGKNFRPSVEGVFGANIPIWRGEWKEGKYGLFVAVPLSADLWLDLFEPVTAPVINTDYRIGAPSATFIHRLGRGFAQNYSLLFAPFKHESTHIGDELTISHLEQGYALRRVNVSYNYTELAFTLNEPENRLASCHTFRMGLLLLFSPQSGWYTVYQGDGDESLLSHQNSPWEAYLQYQYQSPASRAGWQAVASAEIRNRSLYGYTYNGDGLQDERRTFTYHLFAGARFHARHYDGYFSSFSVGLRAYHGNCPHGQFRNLPRFSQAGLCLIFE